MTTPSLGALLHAFLADELPRASGQHPSRLIAMPCGCFSPSSLPMCPVG